MPLSVLWWHSGIMTLSGPIIPLSVLDHLVNLEGWSWGQEPPPSFNLGDLTEKCLFEYYIQLKINVNHTENPCVNNLIFT